MRITYAALYSLFLGFGLSLGSEIYTMGGSHGLVGAGDYTCVYLREDAPWWRQSIPHWFYFLSVPGFVLSMALKNGQVLWRRDTVAMVSIAGGGAPLFRLSTHMKLISRFQLGASTSSPRRSSSTCRPSPLSSAPSSSAFSATLGRASLAKALTWS